MSDLFTVELPKKKQSSKPQSTPNPSPPQTTSTGSNQTSPQSSSHPKDTPNNVKSPQKSSHPTSTVQQQQDSVPKPVEQAPSCDFDVSLPSKPKPRNWDSSPHQSKQKNRQNHHQRDNQRHNKNHSQHQKHQPHQQHHHHHQQQYYSEQHYQHQQQYHPKQSQSYHSQQPHQHNKHQQHSHHHQQPEQYNPQHQQHHHQHASTPSLRPSANTFIPNASSQPYYPPPHSQQSQYPPPPPPPQQQQQQQYDGDDAGYDYGYNDDEYGYFDDDVYSIDEEGILDQIDALNIHGTSGNTNKNGNNADQATDDGSNICPCCSGDPYNCLDAVCAERGFCFCVFCEFQTSDNDPDLWSPASASCVCCKGFINNCHKILEGGCVKACDCTLPKDKTDNTISKDDKAGDKPSTEKVEPVKAEHVDSK